MIATRLCCGILKWMSLSSVFGCRPPTVLSSICTSSMTGCAICAAAGRTAVLGAGDAGRLPSAVVIGAGHAGCEAALAIARTGLKCALLTL
ncbi:MAG: FAD-dependent oxidoreductase, partial [Bifidobacterium castoris]|nr:FAD-dependent oxidoreductase [Bifidobacterium castoris]